MKRKRRDRAEEPDIAPMALENESLKREARVAKAAVEKAGVVQTVTYHCRKKLSSCYLDIYARVLAAVSAGAWPDMPVIPLKLHIKLDVDALPGARETVGDHLKAKYGIRLLEITFERPGRV